MEALQASALPLGYATGRDYAEKLDIMATILHLHPIYLK